MSFTPVHLFPTSFSRIFYDPHFPHLPTFLSPLPLLSYIDMALERPLTPQEEFDEQRTWLLEEKLHQQHQMARGSTDRARLTTIESRIKMVQERLQYYATRRGESIDFYSREKQRRQQEWQSRSDTQGIDVTKAFTSNTAYGPMPPRVGYKNEFKLDKEGDPISYPTYKRNQTGPTNRTLSDIKLEPYQFPGTVSSAYQGNADAQRRAERFYYRMRGAMDVTAGMSPVEAMLRDPEINTMLRRGEISTQHLAAAVGIMQDLRGQQMETALRQLAGESSSGGSSVSSPYMQQNMPSREKREAAIKSAQAQIDAWYEKTARNANISEGHLKEIYPHMSDEQLAFVESLDKHPQAVLKAGPGTGKTDTLMAGWLHLVFNKGVDPENIVFASVTKSGRDALYDRIKRAAELTPQWDAIAAETEQKRTVHSLFLRGLYQQDTQGQAAIDRLGMRQWEMLGAGSKRPDQYANLQEASEASKKTVSNYLDTLLRENHIQRRQSLDKLTNYISAIKQNQGQSKTLPDGTRIRQYDEHYKRGMQLYRTGNTTDPDSIFFLYESNLKRREGMPGIQGQQKKRFDLDDVSYLYQQAAVKGMVSQLKHIFVDELQTLQPDMVRGLRRGTSPETYMLFAGDPGQQVMGHSRPDEMIPKAFPQIGQHMLTGNYRGTARSAATAYGINTHPSVQKTAFSPPQVSMSGKEGLAPTMTTKPSFQELYSSAFSDVLNRIGLDIKRVAHNVQQGAHPLVGATASPGQHPLIFTMKDDRRDFLALVEQELAEEIGTEKAHQAIGMVFDKNNPVVGQESQIPAIMVQQAQSRGFAHPHNFVTRGGQWDEGDYWRMVNIMESRTTEQSHYYATNKNFQYSRYPNEFDFDSTTATDLPHGFARIQSASMENLVYGQGVPYERLSEAEQYHVNMPLPESTGGNSNAALLRVIEGALDLHKAVPVGSRIGMIGEDAGLLPGGLEGDYGDDERKTFSGFQSAPFTHAALSGKYSMAPDMGKLQAGLQYATNLLEAGPTADQGYPLDGVSGFFKEAKGTLGKPPKRLMQLDEAQLPNEVVFQEHDMPKKDWGKTRWEPRHYHQDELRVRGGIRELLESKAAQQHPLVQQLFDEQLTKPQVVRHVRRLAKRYGMKPLAHAIDRASLPIEHVRTALEGTGKQGDEPGLYQQLHRAARGIAGSPNRAQIIEQARAYKFKGLTFKGLDEEKSQKVLGLARDIAIKEDLIKKMEQADPRTVGMGAVAELIRNAMSKRFDYDEGHASHRVMAQKAVEEVSRQIASASLDSFTVERLKEIGLDLATNPEYDLSDEQRQDFASIVKDLENFAQPTFDHDVSGRLTEEELADWKRRSPRQGALLEFVLRDKKTKELKDFAQAFADIKQYQYFYGAMTRAVNSPEKAALLGIGIPESRRAPFHTEMRSYAQRLEESGIVDPQAYIAREGKEGMQFFHTGEMTGLEMYQRRLEEIVHGRVPGRGGQVQSERNQPSEEQKQLAYQQLGLVKQLRAELHSPINQEAWAHTLNILSRTVYAEGAYDPHDKTPEGQYTSGFLDLFKHQKMEGLEGTRTLEQVQEFVEAMQEGTSHIRQTGNVKREHVNRIMAALGHGDLEGEQYVGLRALASQFGSPESQFPLSNLAKNTDLVRQFPGDLGNQYSQLTRLPLGQGREYVFAGGMEGYTPIITGNAQHPGGQVGMTTGMRGTLQPWTPGGQDFGMAKQPVSYRAERIFTPQEFNVAKGMGAKDPLPPLFRFLESESGKTFPVRADQLLDPAYLPMLGVTSTPALPSASVSTVVSPVSSPLPEPPHTVEAPAGVFPRANQEKTEQGFFTSPSTRAPQPTWARSTRSQLIREITGSRVGPGTLSYDEMHDAFVEGGAVRPEAQRQQIQAWRARQGKGFPPLRPRPQNRLPGPTPADLSLTRGTSVVRHTPSRALLPMAPRAHATFLPRPQSSSSRPQLRAGRMLPAVSPLERQLFAQGQGGIHSRALRGGTTPPVLPFRILAGLSPQEKERFAKVLPAWQAHYAKVRGGGQQTQVQHQVHGAIGAPPPDPRVGFTAPAIPVIPGVETMGAIGVPPHENPTVGEQMAGLARDIRTGNQQFGLHALSEEQRKAVESPARFRMVTGGPGGGKTNTIAMATGDWIATQGMLPKNIVSVSALHSGEEELNSRLDTVRALSRREGDPRYELPESSTIHSLAASILLNRNQESGAYPNLEKMGITNYSGRILSEPSAEERAKMTPKQYDQISQVRFLQRHTPGLSDKDAKDAVEFINNMKANRYGPGTDYEAARAKGLQHLKNLATRGTDEAHLAQMHAAMGQTGDLDYNDVLYQTARYLEKFGVDGLPNHLRGTQGLIVDEGQDITRTGADMVSQFLTTIGGNTPSMLIGMDPAQSLLPTDFGAVDVNQVEGLWAGMAQGFGQPLEKHTLEENRRSDLGAIYLNNAIRNRPELADEAKSPVQRPPQEGAALGQYEQFHTAETHPQMFQQMWHNMLKRAGVSYSDIGENVKAGRHPFAGIDFKGPGQTLPKDIPAILNEHKDQAILAHVASQDIAKELGMSPAQAKAVYGQMTSSKMYKRPLISRLLRRNEEPSAKELEKMKQFPVVRHSGARSFDALYPQVEVTQSYGGDDPRAALVQHIKKMFVALSRVRAGGQNDIFATNRPLQAYHKADYLRNPGAFQGGYTDLKGHAIHEQYPFEQYGTMQVPQGFGELLGERDKALLKSGAVSPTDSFFPPEVQPAIQQIAKELGIGTQAQQQVPPPLPSQQIQQLPVGIDTQSETDKRAKRYWEKVRQKDPSGKLEKGLKQAIADNLEHALPSGRVSRFVNKNGVDEQDLEALAAYTQHAKERGYTIGNWVRANDFRTNPAAYATLERPSSSPSPGIPRSQIIRTSTPPPSGTSTSPSSATVAGLHELYGPLAGPLRRQLTDQQMTASRQAIEGYHGTLQKTFAQLPAGVLPADFIAAEQERISQQSGSTPHAQLTKQGAMAVLGHLSNNPTQLLSSSASSPSSGVSSPSTIKIEAKAGSKVEIQAESGVPLTSSQKLGQQGPPGGTPPPLTAGQVVNNLLNGLPKTPMGMVPFQNGGGIPQMGQRQGQQGTPGGPPPSGNGGGGGGDEEPPIFSYNTPLASFGRELARIGYEMSFSSGILKQHADNALQEGGDYRMASLALDNGQAQGGKPPGITLGQTESQLPGIVNDIPLLPQLINAGANDQLKQWQTGAPGTNGFFNFQQNIPGNIADLQQNYLPWFSMTRIGQGLHDYTTATGTPFSADNYVAQRNGNKSANTPDTVNATTDIMGIAALSGMDAGQLTQMMTQVTGYSATSPSANNAGITQLAGFMQGTFGGNYSQQNVQPYLSAMTNLVPTLYGTGLSEAGLGPTYGPGYSSQSPLHAASLLKLALNAGYTASDLPDVANTYGTLAQVGSAPNLQQQYQFAQLFGEKKLTASPEYFQFQQQQLGYKEQAQQLQTGIKMNVSQLTVNADNASIALSQANLQMGQEQFAQNTASFNFSQWMQNQELGPIGESPQQTGRASYFNFMNRQMGAGYNPLNADSASTFQPVGQPFGLQNEEFYAGIEHQRSMLTLSRSPLMADAAYQEQMKYLNEQETFYNQQLKLQNDQRAFDKTWAEQSLAAQAKVLAAQKQSVAAQDAQLGYDKAMAVIQGKYLPQQLALLQQIATQSLQQIQGQGPIGGKNVQPSGLITQLAEYLNQNGYVNTQKRIEGLQISPQDQGILMKLVQQLAGGASLSSIEKQLSGSGDKQLLAELQYYANQGAGAGQIQQAGDQNKNLQQGGTDQDWKNLITAMNNSIAAENSLAQAFSPTSALQKYLGEIGGNIGPLSTSIGGLSQVIDALKQIFLIFVGGAGGAGGGMGGGSGMGGSAMRSLPSSGGGSSGVGGEFDMGPSLADNKYTLGWLNLAEDMVAYQQQRKHLAGPSHFGISSPNVNADFGQKLWYGIHQGVDFQANQGTPLLSFNDGIVKNTGFFPWGGEVDIQIPGGMTERYLHLSQIGVTTGQKLKAGDRIGLTGGGTKQSGFGYWSHGPHSHVQVDRGNINQGIDPWPIWALFGDTNIRDFYIGAQAQYSQQQSQKFGSRGYVQNGGGGGTGSSLFHMADGGIAMRPLKAQLMDAGEPEAVIPLSKLRSVMASVASGTPGSSTTASPVSSMSGSRHFTVGAVHVTINTASATMTEQEKDTLMADLISVLDQAAEEKLGTLH